MKQLIPWLAIFLFGIIVFGVGKVFQASEKRKHEERKAAIEREKILAAALAQAPKAQRQELVGIMEAAAGSGQHGGRRHSN
jgi:uncharacterized membrane protein